MTGTILTPGGKDLRERIQSTRNGTHYPAYLEEMWDNLDVSPTLTVVAQELLRTRAHDATGFSRPSRRSGELSTEILLSPSTFSIRSF